MKNINSTFLWIAIFLAGGGLGAAWLVRRVRQSPLLPQAWLPVLSGKHSTEKARQLFTQAEARYRALLAARPQPRNRALRHHLRNILSGLAMYQVLLEANHGDRPATLDEIRELFRAWTEQRIGGQMRMVRRFPVPQALFRLGFAMRMAEFPAEGWDIRWIENSPRCIAFDIHACFYLKTLSELGAPELTASFCEGDDHMGGMLPPSILFQRTQTLGRGGASCDFCYEFVGQRSAR